MSHHDHTAFAPKRATVSQELVHVVAVRVRGSFVLRVNGHLLSTSPDNQVWVQLHAALTIKKPRSLSSDRAFVTCKPALDGSLHESLEELVHVDPEARPLIPVMLIRQPKRADDECGEPKGSPIEPISSAASQPIDVIGGKGCGRRQDRRELTRITSDSLGKKRRERREPADGERDRAVLGTVLLEILKRARKAWSTDRVEETCAPKINPAARKRELLVASHVVALEPPATNAAHRANQRSGQQFFEFECVAQLARRTEAQQVVVVIDERQHGAHRNLRDDPKVEAREVSTTDEVAGGQLTRPLNVEAHVDHARLTTLERRDRHGAQDGWCSSPLLQPATRRQAGRHQRKHQAVGLASERS